MDRERFDALTRLFGTQASRRATIGSLVGAVFLGATHEAEAAKRGKHGHGNKKKPKRKACFGTKGCLPPKDGQDLEGCNLAERSIAACNGCSFRGADLGGADLGEGSFQGASFRDANLRDADLEDADLSGTSFRGACLVGASFLGANIHGARFEGAIFCNTVQADGQTNNNDCGKATRCCPTSGCVNDSDCPGEEICVDGTCQAQNPTCAADPDACSDGFIQCGGGSGSSVCFCYVTTEGDSRCLNINQQTNPFCAGTPCEDSSDCGQGERCAALHGPTTCCTAKICGPVCQEFDTAGRRGGRSITPPRP